MQQRHIPSEDNLSSTTNNTNSIDILVGINDNDNAKSENVLFKIIPLGFMFFCIIFNYSILRDTKDVLVITAPGSGQRYYPS